LSRVNEPRHFPAQPPDGKGIIVVITGDGATIYYSPQQAGDAGTNVTAGGPASGPVTVSGGQSAQSGRDAVIAGRDAGSTVAKGKSAKQGWWARLRKRGMIVAFATIVGAIAVVIGTIVAVCAWTGWTP
jgi:hypothetical protein